jgi:hypothetical protein
VVQVLHLEVVAEVQLTGLVRQKATGLQAEQVPDAVRKYPGS